MIADGDELTVTIHDRRTVFDPGSSLYTLASARFHEGKVVLREHFRCLPDIIGFSNRRYYHSVVGRLTLTASQIRGD